MPAFTSALFSLAQFKSTTCGDGDPSLFFRPCVVNFLVQGACCQIGNTARYGLAADSPTQDDGGRLSITISGGKMRKLLILGVFILAVGVVPVRAQEYPKAEVFGGYQYIRLNPGGTNCQGFGGAAAANVSIWLGVAGDFGYCRVTGLPSGVSAHAVNYMFGPRVTYRSYGSLTPFAHVLFGGQHFGGTGGGTANSFAMALGGGADYKVTEHVALRLIQVEYLYTHFAGTRQNNARIESGIAYRWGGR